MAVTLFTIGDSISQGFMSGAAARTDLSYSTILAQILKAQKSLSGMGEGRHGFKKKPL